MGGKCSMHGINEKCIKNFWLDLKRRDCLVELGLYGRIILKRVLENVKTELDLYDSSGGLL